MVVRPSFPLLCATQSTQRARIPASPGLVRAALAPQRFIYVDQLAQYLKRHFILHQPGRFLIIPKPFGISCTGERDVDGGVFTDGVHNKKEDSTKLAGKCRTNITITDCVPLLAHSFQEPNLSFCVGLKRYLSGAIVLPANGVEMENIKKSIKFSALKTDECTHHYRSVALLMGRLPSEEGELTGYATFQPVGSHKEYIFVPGHAKKRAKAGKFAVEGTMDWKVLEEKHGCSLVEFGVNKFARHLPRLMFSHMLAPVLGDSMYVNRMTVIDGAPALLKSSKANKNAQLCFPSSLSDRLGLPAPELHKTLPIYCHVYQTIFPRFGWNLAKNRSEQDVQHLVASCPPPSHFLAMVEALDMDRSLSGFFKKIEQEDE